MIHSSVLCIIGVVFLRGKAKIGCEVGIPKKGSDTFNHVTVEDVTHFGTNHDRVMLKVRTSRKLFVNDCIHLLCVLEQQSKFFCGLKFISGRKHGESCIDFDQQSIAYPFNSQQLTKSCRTWPPQLRPSGNLPLQLAQEWRKRIVVSLSSSCIVHIRIFIDHMRGSSQPWKFDDNWVVLQGFLEVSLQSESLSCLC
jgi:hypothetical protein